MRPSSSFASTCSTSAPVSLGPSTLPSHRRRMGGGSAEDVFGASRADALRQRLRASATPTSSASVAAALVPSAGAPCFLVRSHICLLCL